MTTETAETFVPPIQPSAIQTKIEEVIRQAGQHAEDTTLSIVMRMRLRAIRDAAHEALELFEEYVQQCVVEDYARSAGEGE